jgi:hypothetical protein
VTVVEPRWASWSFLLYAGGLTLLGAAVAFLSWLGDRHGLAAVTGAAAGVLVVGGAAGLALRSRHPIAAGLLGLIAAWGVLVAVAAAITWAGWAPSGDSSALFAGVSWQLVLVELAEIVAVLVALRLFRFPLLVWQGAGAVWLLVVGLLSDGGDWSAVVDLAVGLVFLAAALRLDRGPRRPYAFWLHVWAAGTIAGGVLYLVGSHARWVAAVVLALLFVALAERFGRSSWAVFGAAGILAAAAHWASRASDVSFSLFGDQPPGATRGWASALVFAAAGVVLMGLGGALGLRARQRRVAAETAQA